MLMTMVTLNRGNRRRIKNVSNVSGLSVRDGVDQGCQIVLLSYGDNAGQVDWTTLAVTAAPASPSHD